jgi:hypothetical protein
MDLFLILVLPTPCHKRWLSEPEAAMFTTLGLDRRLKILEKRSLALQSKRLGHLALLLRLPPFPQTPCKPCSHTHFAPFAPVPPTFATNRGRVAGFGRIPIGNLPNS